MHILVIASVPYIPKGKPWVGIYQHDQAKSIKRSGYKVGVIDPPVLNPLTQMLKSTSRPTTGMMVDYVDGIPVYRYSGWNWKPKINQGLFRLRLFYGMKLYNKYINEHGKPDIIHAHMATFAGILACKINKMWNIPYLITEHYSGYARGIIPEYANLHIKVAFKNADKRLVVSPKLGRVLEREFGDSVKPWKYVPNVLSQRFEKTPIQKELKNKLDKSFIFCNIGSLMAKKGQADLLRAFALKFKGENNVQLRIGGNGSLRRELEKLTKQLKIEKQISFLGGLTPKQVYEEMKTCDIYVQPSHFETFGITLIEALSCGKPVIATKCGGPEVIIRKGNGVLLQPKDVEGLGEAMVAMMENIDSFDKEWIRQDCIERFGEKSFISQLSSIYQDILKIEAT